MKDIRVLPLKKERESSLEVLRILAMMLVMLIHYSTTRMPTTMEMTVNNPLKACFNLEMLSISIICVHCFILISGYFGIKWKMRSFWNLIFQVVFWLVSGYLISRFLIEPYFPMGNDLSVRQFFSNFLIWTQARWFISAYLVLFIVSPLVNSFIEKTDSSQLLRYILVFYVFSTIYGYFMLSEEFNKGYSALSLVGIYLLGAWLRKSELRVVKWNKWYDLTGFIVCTLVLTGISFGLLRAGFSKSIHGYLNPIAIVESMFLFQFFRKLNMGRIKWVNYIAAGAFSAFLLQCNPFLGSYCYGIWKRIDSNFEYSAFFVVLSIILIYIIAVMIDKIRVLIWNWMTGSFNRMMSRKKEGSAA